MPQSIYLSRFSSLQLSGRYGRFDSAGLESQFKALRIDQSARADDAVKVSLSQRSRNLSKPEQAEAAEQAAEIQAPRSALRSVLDSLSRITLEIGSYRSQIESGALTTEQQSVLETEISTLTSEYQRIVSSDTFKSIREATESISSSLASGASGSAVYNSLFSQRTLLGDDFLALVRGGGIAQLTSLRDGVGSLQAIDITDAATDSSKLGYVTDVLKKAYQSLEAPALDSSEQTAATAPLLSGQSPIPTLQETIYAGSGEFALALRSFSPTDMLKAAVSGIDIGPISQLVLVSNPLKDEDEEKSAAAQSK